MDLRVPVTQIAQRLGLLVERWEEDGLGEASGMFLGLASGRIVLLRELRHAVEHLGAEGPSVHADAGDVASVGPGPIVTEIVRSIGLADDEVNGVASSDAQQDAAKLVASVAAYLKAHPPKSE